MASDADYWRTRRNELLAQMENDEHVLDERLAKIYAGQSRRLEREIAAYYQKYGEGNVIEYRNLMRSLPDDDRSMLIERMEEFARKYPQHAHLMPVRESIYRLNELEGIQASIRLQQMEIGAIEQGELDAHFREYARRSANLAAEQLGFGKNFYSIDAQVVVETVGAAWAKEKSFSDAIWDNREKLAAYLNDDLAKMIARGTSYDKCAKALVERFEGVSRNNAKRLVFTEGTFLFNEAQAQVHESEFGSYALSCVSGACEVCRELQAEQKRHPARFADRSPGVNFPPMHPWCRCSYTVEVEDWDAWIEDYVARRGGDSLTHATRLRSEAMEREPLVSSVLRSIETMDARLEGFDHRLKGQGSLARKIRSDAAYIGCGEDEAAELIHDVLRYTYVLPDETFVSEFARIRTEMEALGCKMVEVKNTLRIERVGYRGVNTKVAAPDGYIFELQFHTRKSLDVKDRLNHPLYERARLPETPDSEKDSLRDEMVRNSMRIPTPPGIEKVML